MSSEWQWLPFLSHPDEIVNFNFPHHAVALHRFRKFPSQLFTKACVIDWHDWYFYTAALHINADTLALLRNIAATSWAHCGSLRTRQWIYTGQPVHRYRLWSAEAETALNDLLYDKFHRRQCLFHFYGVRQTQTMITKSPECFFLLRFISIGQNLFGSVEINVLPTCLDWFIFNIISRAKYFSNKICVGVRLSKHITIYSDLSCGVDLKIDVCTAMYFRPFNIMP